MTFLCSSEVMMSLSGKLFDKTVLCVREICVLGNKTPPKHISLNVCYFLPRIKLLSPNAKTVHRHAYEYKHKYTLMNTQSAGGRKIKGAKLANLQSWR